MEKHPKPQMGTQGDVIVQRFIAFIIDAVVLGVFSGIMFVLGGLFAELIHGVVFLLFWLIIFVVSLVYALLLEGLYGYTPGKYVMGLVVVKDDGSPCTIGASIIRNLLLIVDQLPTAYILGIILIFVTEDNQRVGDMAASTVVVRQV